MCTGQPARPLVHRHTHRVTRGASSPSAAPTAASTPWPRPSTVCLAVNQASSIQNWGVTCEALTLGHNPFALPLAKGGALALPTVRPPFLCEVALEATNPSHARAASVDDVDVSLHDVSVSLHGAASDYDVSVHAVDPLKQGRSRHGSGRGRRWDRRPRRRAAGCRTATFLVVDKDADAGDGYLHWQGREPPCAADASEARQSAAANGRGKAGRRPQR